MPVTGHPATSFPQGVLEIMDAWGGRDASEIAYGPRRSTGSAHIIDLYEAEVSRVPDGSFLGARLRCRGRPF
ncbi:hypothetical protein [uncultured Megasphaera sp.]|uniref:hypothetical protein n=1 Tax=uncultured Megasphaera sp. TaxID=165188 RepID=UPI00265F2738|nr:hypothetical protein [uncultured Megasphaera sp.]